MHLATCLCEPSNHDIFVRSPQEPMVLVADGANVEGVIITSIILVSCLHEANMFVEVFGLNPLVQSASQPQTIVMSSMASLDLIDSFGGVGAPSHIHRVLIAPTWSQVLYLEILVCGSSDICEP